MMDDKFGYDDDTKHYPSEKTKYQQLEELILPLIDNLIKTSDKSMINWPNRKEPLEKLKKDILKITRG